VVCLPEGVRLLSVFLSADEYKDLIQCCDSSDLNLTKKPADQVRKSGSEKHTVHAESDTEYAAVGNTATEESCKQRDCENSTEVFASIDTESPTQCHSQHLDAEESAAIYKSSAISGEFQCSFMLSEYRSKY